MNHDRSLPLTLPTSNLFVINTENSVERTVLQECKKNTHKVTLPLQEAFTAFFEDINKAKQKTAILKVTQP